MDSAVISKLVSIFDKHRTQKYQSYQIGGTEYPGRLHNAHGKVVGTVSFKEQLQYLRLEDIGFQDSTVLDIGCNIGAFSEYAAMQGARSTVGIDTSSYCVGEARILRTFYEMISDRPRYPQFRHENFMDNTRVFDITIFLAILHHCPNAFRALQQLSLRTRETAIIEVQLYDESLNGVKLTDLSKDITSRHGPAQFGLGYYPEKEGFLEAVSKTFKSYKVIGPGKLPSRLVVHAYNSGS